MRTYLVSYELANPEMNQPYLADAIMGLGEAWARPLANVWYLRSESPQEVIQRRLARLLDEQDGLIVQGIREEAMFRNTGLRWFRRRRQSADTAASNIVSFPAPAEAASPENGISVTQPFKVAS